MRVLYLLVAFQFAINCTYSQTRSLEKIRDSTSGDNGNSIFINFRAIPELAKFEKRYRILTNANEDLHAVEVSYSLQNTLESAGHNDSSILKGFDYLKNNWTTIVLTNPEIPVGQKEIYYGAWRNKLVKSTSDDEIKQVMSDGTRQLIGLGYTDLGKDFLPFITGLMEESHMINYDHARLFPGKASRRIVSSVEILNALDAQDYRVKAGVCRDIHATGRELLKSLSETWFDHFYPEKKIDLDDYIFLQTWTTNKSQHVTISLINPINTNEVYELDWGRVIEKENITGFNSGRLYGNNYRIWQYNSEKQKTIPVDFKRTQFGKILDEDILTREEYRQFNGIYDEEFYSDISYQKNSGRSGKMKYSLGTYHPWQKYFLTTWVSRSDRKKITGFLNHSNTFALQAALNEDTRKKNFLYPQNDWKSVVSLMTVPRYISSFRMPEYTFGNFTLETYLKQQVDLFFIVNSFSFYDNINDRQSNGFAVSGDGNITFSNGFNIRYNTRNRTFSTSAGVQARSCMLANDIRNFSPNPSILLPNVKIITPAIDVMGNMAVKVNRFCNLSLDVMFEFTNMDAVLFSGSATGMIAISEIIDLGLSVGSNDQLKGMKYFWYPSDRKWLDISIYYSDNSFSAGLLKMPVSGTTFNLSFRRYLEGDSK